MNRPWLFLPLLLVAMYPTPSQSQSPTPVAQETWTVATTPPKPFQVAPTLAEWEKQRADIRRTLLDRLGDLPGRPATPTVRILSREDRSSHWYEHFEFDNGAGARVPGVLLLPKNRTGKVPGILYCHWHGGEYDGGKIELFQTKHTPQPPGPTLVEKGYAVLAIDAYCFGERNGRGPGGPEERGGAGELTASKFQLWAGRSLWGMILRDDLMALDYLCSRPEVDSQRIGITGISMGATRTWWLMALDERVRAGVAVACLTRYQDLIDARGLKYHGIYYYVPGLLRHFDTEAIIALCAPRALLCLNGDRDLGSPAAGIHQIETSAAPAWDRYNRTAHFRSQLFRDVGHEYTSEMWTQMLAWMDQNLSP